MRVREAILAQRDRAVVLAGLAAVTALSWVYFARLAGNMAGMDAMERMSMPQMSAWGAGEIWLVFWMWTVMMAGMMTPSASPMVLTYAAMARRRHAERSPAVPAAMFLLAYLVVWTLFSAAATLAQWALHTTALLSPVMVSTSSVLSGVLLIAAGVYQFSSWKQACLTHCRHPLAFLLSEWRDGTSGAFVLGLRHGVFCIGCCWLLMALLFVAGVMNLLWCALLTVCVLVEKTVPAGDRVSRVLGALAAGWGVWLLLAA